VYSVALSSTGKALSGSADTTVRVWEVESGCSVWVMGGHWDKVWSVALGEDGRRALSGSRDATVRVWGVETGQCERVLEGHLDRVWSVALSLDGKRALSGSYD
jgi:WD40 repeat protein